MKLKLGDTVKDSITDFTGTVVAITKYLDGYIQLGVQSDKLHNEVPLEVQWFYDTRVIKIDKKNNNLGFNKEVK